MQTCQPLASHVTTVAVVKEDHHPSSISPSQEDDILPQVEEEDEDATSMATLVYTELDYGVTGSTISENGFQHDHIAQEDGELEELDGNDNELIPNGKKTAAFPSHSCTPCSPRHLQDRFCNSDFGK